METAALQKIRLKNQALVRPVRWREQDCKVKDDQANFEQIIFPIQHRMKHSIWRVVRNAEAVEDTFQDALAIIWKKRERILKHPKPDAFILKICLNASYDTLRRSKHHLKNLSLEDVTLTPAATAPEAADKLEGKKIEAEVLSAVGRLPRSQALCILMRVIQGYSYNEISETLGCSETTARIHVSRARRKLSRWLKPLLPHHMPETWEQPEISHE
jgi:RNA polymerase sigma-70 factor (ECF subfamily)